MTRPVATALLIVGALLMPLCAVASGAKGWEFPFRMSIHGEFLADAPDLSNISAGFGGSLETGLRRGDFEGFLMVERDWWAAVDDELALHAGVLNLGVGGALYLFERRVSIRVAAGTCTLLFPTTFHSPGQTGAFLSVHPATLRWPVATRWALTFSPISFTLLMPALDEPALRRLEYRTTFGIEVAL